MHWREENSPYAGGLEQEIAKLRVAIRTPLTHVVPSMETVERVRLAVAAGGAATSDISNRFAHISDRST